MGSQVIEQVVWSIPGFGPVCQGIQPVIRVRTYPRFQVLAPTQSFRLGTQAADGGAHPHRRFGSVRPHSPAADLNVHCTLIPGFGPVQLRQPGS